MATLSISLPDPMKSWVDAQAVPGRYDDASGYVRALIRRDQERTEKIAQMQILVDEARASGLSTESMDDLRARAMKQART